MVLGGGLLLLFVLIFLSGNPRDRGNDEPDHGNVVILTSANWHREVVESPVPVVVDFWGPGCPPCRRLAPIIARLADQYKGRVKVGKVNLANAQQLAADYDIRIIPTVCIFNGGPEPRQTIVGPESEAELVAEIDRVLKSGTDGVAQ